MDLKSYITTEYFQSLDHTPQCFKDLLASNEEYLKFEYFGADSNEGSSKNNEGLADVSFSDYLKFSEQSSTGSPLKLPTLVHLPSHRDSPKEVNTESYASTLAEVEETTDLEVDFTKITTLDSAKSPTPDSAVIPIVDSGIIPLLDSAKAPTPNSAKIPLVDSVNIATLNSAKFPTLDSSKFRPLKFHDVQKNSTQPRSVESNRIIHSQRLLKPPSAMFPSETLNSSRITCFRKVEHPKKVYHEGMKKLHTRTILPSIKGPPNRVLGFRRQRYSIQDNSSRILSNVSQNSFTISHFQSSAFSSQMNQQVRNYCSPCINQPAIIVLPITASYIPATKRNMYATFRPISHDQPVYQSQQLEFSGSYYSSRSSKCTIQRSHDVNIPTNQYIDPGFTNPIQIPSTDETVYKCHSVQNKENIVSDFANSKGKPKLPFLTHFNVENTTTYHSETPLLSTFDEAPYYSMTSTPNQNPTDQNDIIFDLENEEVSSLFNSSLNTEHYPGSVDEIQAIKEKLLRETSPFQELINDGKKEQLKYHDDVKSDKGTKRLNQKEMITTTSGKKGPYPPARASPSYLNSGKKNKMMGLGEYDGELLYNDTSDYEMFDPDDYTSFKKRIMRENTSSKHNMKLRKRSNIDCKDGKKDSKSSQCKEGTNHSKEHVHSEVQPPVKKQKYVYASESKVTQLLKPGAHVDIPLPKNASTPVEKNLSKPATKQVTLKTAVNACTLKLAEKLGIKSFLKEGKADSKPYFIISKPLELSPSKALQRVVKVRKSQLKKVNVQGSEHVQKHLPKSLVFNVESSVQKQMEHDLSKPIKNTTAQPVENDLPKLVKNDVWKPVEKVTSIENHMSVCDDIPQSDENDITMQVGSCVTKFCESKALKHAEHGESNVVEFVDAAVSAPFEKFAPKCVEKSTSKTVKKRTSKLKRKHLPMRASARKAKRKSKLRNENISRLQSRRLMKKKFLHKCCHEKSSESEDIVVFVEGEPFTLFPSQGLQLILERDEESVEENPFDDLAVPKMNSLLSCGSNDDFPPSPPSFNEMESKKRNRSWVDDEDCWTRGKLPRQRYASVDADDIMSDKSRDDASPARADDTMNNPLADFLHFIDVLSSPKYQTT